LHRGDCTRQRSKNHFAQLLSETGEGSRARSLKQTTGLLLL
jgi:hypothetical protein